MIVNEIHDLSNTRVIELLKIGLADVDRHVADNYSPMNSHINSNLFYLLENGRYATGTYYVVEEGGKYVSSAGWNKYNDTTALLMTRLYVSEECRSQYFMGNLLLPRMFHATTEYDNVWMTFNLYNKALYDWFSRFDDKKNIWPDIWKNFKPIGMKTIYNTEQYVVELQR